MKYTRGTNQYKKRFHHKYTQWLLVIAVFMLTVGTLGGGLKEKIWRESVLSPLSDNPIIPVVQAKEPENPEIDEIVQYIAKVFKPSGKDVVVRAINCFYSESGLRVNAYNYNPSSNSEDIGIAQVNLKYHPHVTKEEMYQYKKNINEAYRIYKSRGNFSAWYGKGCK